MSTTRRLIDSTCLGALFFALILKTFFGQGTWQGLSRAQFALILPLAVCFIRLGITLSDTFSRRVPWGRLLLPAIVTLELLRVATGTTSRLQQRITLAVLETGFIAGAALFVIFRWQKFKAVDHLEYIFEEIFSRFLPPSVSRMAARELVLLWEGLRWCLRGFRLQPPAGFGYVEQSYIKIMPVLIVMALFTEGIAYEILVHQHPLIRVVVHVVEVWAVLWCFGLYATMKLRPHQVAPELVRLRCGVLSSCEFKPHLLLDVQAESGDSPPRKKNVARITAKGAPMLQLRLKEPVSVQRMFLKPKAFDRILVSADDPVAFRNALIAAKGIRQRAGNGAQVNDVEKDRENQNA